MLTVLHPQILHHIASFAAGISPLSMDGSEDIVLVIKGPKEAILAAKINMGFKFYFVPIEIRGIQTLALMTAFFDDVENPLYLFMPLFADELTNVVHKLLRRPEFDVHFFDESNRELLGYRATNARASSPPRILTESLYLPMTHDLAAEYHEKALIWFNLRSRQDDEDAVSITFTDPLFPDDLLIQDTTLRATGLRGAPNVSMTSLVRDGEPGKFQEVDIARLLLRVFPATSIYLNPVKIDDGEELADILVVTRTNAIFIQAKDSPNTDKSLRRSIRRKMTTVEGHINKAVRQLSGSLKYCAARDLVRVNIGDDTTDIDLRGRRFWGIAVVNETYTTEYQVYSPPVLELSHNIGVACLLMDFHELHNYTHYRRNELDFIDCMRTTFEFAVKNHQYPRSRFGFIEDGSESRGSDNGDCSD